MEVLLYRGNSWISKAILWQTRGRYSHAAILHNSCVYEAREFQGVQKTEGITLQPDELCDHFHVPTTQAEADDILRFLDEQIDKPYDYGMVLRFISRRQQTRRSIGKWFCSELVFAAFLHAGIKLLERTEPWEVSPQMLSRSPLLRKPLLAEQLAAR